MLSLANAVCVLSAAQAATLGNWFSGLLQRQDQLVRWLTMGRPRAYWLTGFFNPQVRLKLLDRRSRLCFAHI